MHRARTDTPRAESGRVAVTSKRCGAAGRSQRPRVCGPCSVPLSPSVCPSPPRTCPLLQAKGSFYELRSRASHPLATDTSGLLMMEPRPRSVQLWPEPGRIPPWRQTCPKSHFPSSLTCSDLPRPQACPVCQRHMLCPERAARSGE